MSRKRIKVSDNFYLDEFMHPSLYYGWGEKCKWLLDDRIIELAQACRDFWNAPITINNWATGGKFKLSGFRPHNTRIGARYSQHKYGRAIDIKIKGANYNQMRRDVLDNFEEYFKIFDLGGMEEGTPTWLHLDLRTRIDDKLKIVPFR